MRSLSLVAFTAWCLTAQAATSPPPQAPPSSGAQARTKTALPTTPAELIRLKAGVKLHDAGQYDEAIAIYENMLYENPDCVAALFELANSSIAKKDYAKALEIATKGTEYASPDLASFFMLIGSVYDDTGDPAKAIDTYRHGIAISPTPLLYFNLGLTFERLGQDDDARTNLKQSARLNPNHASTQLELGKVFFRHGLTTPCLFALSRFLILDPTSPRTADAFRLWYQILNGGTQVQGNAILVTTPLFKTDEGDFKALDLVMAAGKTMASMQPSDTPVIASVSLVHHVTALFSALSTTDASVDRSTFAWSYYAPYFSEIQKRGYVEPFVYWVSQRTDLAGVKEWVADPANRQRATEFVQWSQKYVWPRQ